MEHGMHCMARLVRALLGPDAVSASKLGFGMQLRVLGVDMTPSQWGVRCQPAPEKVAKCLYVIELALQENKLLPGSAMKLAGRLSWASLFMFRRLGRAMLRPIFRQAHGG